MSAAPEKAKEERRRAKDLTGIFEPDAGETTGAPRSGFDREILQKEPIPFRWPTTMTERRKVVRMWRTIAMRVLHDLELSFRLMAVIDDHMMWGIGEIWASSEKLASAAGGCNEKTIRRDIQKLKKLGFLIVENGYRTVSAGQRVKTRAIRLALPSDYDGDVPDHEDDDQTDTRCPNGRHDQTDTRCPEVADTCCPIIVPYVDANFGGGGAT
ncbi:MAG TPA: hypothetical protein VGO22_17315 [Pseudorhizobium sp.]|jgi:biotin operon repressor|nr:hypothetical protein [Pseudorhizobium sp.]